MTVTLTGSKYSGAITSVGTTTLNNSGASFNSADFNAQRIVGLWNSAGTTYKGVAWVRRWVSATQLELKTRFLDYQGNVVTQASGDTYLVSKNFSDVATTGIAVSGKSISITDSIVFGTSGSTNSLCFYDDDKQITISNGVTASNSNAFFQMTGGLIIFGQLEDYATFKNSHPISLLNQNTVSGVNGRGGICCKSTAAKFWWLGGSIVAQSLPMYLGETYPSSGSAGEWQKYWNVYSNGDFYSAPNGGNWSANSTKQEVVNIVSYAEGTDSINLRWGDGLTKGGVLAAVGSNALSIFGSDVAGTYNIGDPNFYTVIQDCGIGGLKPNLWRSGVGTPLTQIINYANVVTPNRRHSYETGTNVANPNNTGYFVFYGTFSNLINGTLGLIKNNNLLSTVQSSGTVSGNSLLLSAQEAVVVGYTETVTENSWIYGLYLYGYSLVFDVFITTTAAASGGQLSKIVVFGKPIAQVIDTTLTQLTVAIVAAYTTINTLDQLYDYAQYWKALNTTNAIYPSPALQLIDNNGSTYTPTPLNVTIDTTATFNITNFVNTSTGTIVIKPTSALSNGVKNSSFQLAAGKTLTFAQNGDKSSAIYLIPATGIVVVAPGATNLQKSVFTAGATINVSSGTATVTVDSTTGITAGTGVTLQTPQASIIAPNIASGTRVQAARLEPYSVPSSAITTGASGIITIAGNRFKSASPATLVYFQLQAGATIPTSSPQIADGKLYYVAASGVADGLTTGQFKLSLTQGGTPITFSAQGSGNFTLTGITELDNSLAGAGGYSLALTETSGTLIRVSAQPWQNTSGCTAGIFFQRTYAWNSTSGITIPDTISIAATPDTTHNQLIGSSVKAFSTAYTLTTDGSTVTGISFTAQGVINFDTSAIARSLPDGTKLLLAEEAYLYTVYYRSTAAGIRLIANQLTAQDGANFIVSGLKLSSNGALVIAGAYVSSADGSYLIATGSSAIYLNADQRGVLLTTTAGSMISPSQQQIRDAQALPLSAGVTPAATSIDDKLNANLLRIE